MRAVSQRIAGKLFIDNGRGAITLFDPAAPKDGQDLLFLRYAFITRGPEDHIFPAFLLDDWGTEVRSLRLYDWVREYGDRFPRGELFGFEQDGRETQLFLRELELYARYPLYAFASRRQPVEEGVLLSAILLPVAGATAVPQRIKRPADIPFPLKRARVSWWEVGESVGELDFSFLDRP